MPDVVGMKADAAAREQVAQEQAARQAAQREQEQRGPAPQPAPQPQPFVGQPQEPQQAEQPAQHVYYSSCKEARAAGAASLHAGDPGYRPGLNRDRDGVAYER